MPFTNYLSKKILDEVIRGAAYTAPSIWYVGLATNATTPDGTGANGDTGWTEVSTSGTAYARKAVNNNTTEWPAASGSNNASKSNSNAITYNQATAAWGNLAWWGLWDASTAGGLCIFGALNGAPRAVNANDTPSFAAGALTISLT